MRITFIDHYAGSPRYGLNRRCFQFASSWVRLGHDVLLVGASYTHLRLTNPATRGWRTEETEAGVRQLWLRTPAYHGNGAGRVGNILAFATQLRWRAAAIAARFRPEVVVVSSPQPFACWGAKAIAHAANVPWIFEVRDIWPLTLIEIGRAAPSHPLVWWMQRTEDWAYRSADGLASPLSNAVEHCRAHGWTKDFCWVPNAAVLDDPAIPSAQLPQQHQTVIDSLRQGGAFLLGYAGSIGPSQGLQVLLECAGRTRPQKFAFVLLGEGVEAKALEETAARRGLTNVFRLPRVELTAVPSFLRQMDALFYSLANKPLFRFGTSSNKIIEYMVAGRPVISATPAADDPVAKSGCGIAIPPEDAPALAAALSELRAMSPAQRAELGLRGQRYVRSHLNIASISDRYLEYMRLVISRYETARTQAVAGAAHGDLPRSHAVAPHQHNG